MKLANNIKKDSTIIFSNVNNNKNFSSKAGPLKNPNDGMIISDDKQMANVMVNYFGSVFNNEATNIFSKSEVHFDCKNNKPLTSIDINKKVVLNKLQTLKINKSLGPDDLYPQLHYELRFFIASPFTKLYKLS